MRVRVRVRVCVRIGACRVLVNRCPLLGCLVHADGVVACRVTSPHLTTVCYAVRTPARTDTHHRHPSSRRRAQSRDGGGSRLRGRQHDCGRLVGVQVEEHRSDYRNDARHSAGRWHDDNDDDDDDNKHENTNKNKPATSGEETTTKYATSFFFIGDDEEAQTVRV